LLLRLLLSLILFFYPYIVMCLEISDFKLHDLIPPLRGVISISGILTTKLTP